jgi:predicted nucleic acid-binding protein
MSPNPSVVSNAGPLMALAKLNLLHLLRTLYGYVHIPRSVYNEVVIEGMRQGYEDARTLYLFLNQMGWSPEDVDSATIPADLQEAHLDRGERDTLTLAVALGDAVVLMDGTAGREAARAHGLTIRGSLGVLVESYRQGLIEASQLHLYFTEIAHRPDIWVSQALVERLLQEVFGD